MSAHCCDHARERGAAAANSPTYRRVLWVALSLNLAMFFVEIGAGLAAQSASLLADSLDFLGDAGNYGLSLFVLGMALQWRARASLLKAASMGAFGLWVAATTIQQASVKSAVDSRFCSRVCLRFCYGVGPMRRRDRKSVV